LGSVRFFRAGSLFVFLTFSVVTGGAQTAWRLSLAEAMRLAQARSPLASAAEARVRGAGARLQGAGALAGPLLSIAHGVGQNTGGLDEDYLLSQTIELGDKRRQRVRAARAEHEAALAERAGTGHDLTFAAQSAYYEALRADAERQQAAESLTTAQTFATAAETQFQAGDVARSNVVRSRIELSRAEQALSAADTERANRYATLRSLTGLPNDAELTLTDTLTFTPVAYRLPALTALALQNRADLRAARKTREARDAAVHGARAQSQPDLLLEARHSWIDPSVGGNSLRFGLIFPLFDLGRTRADARSASFALQEQEATLSETERTARLDVETALRNLEQARRVVESFQGGRLERSKELLDMAQTGYDRGASSYLELLDAQQVYRSERTEYARALAAYNIARAALQRAVGGTLP
jgi:outer membrane protein TolC